MWELTIEPGRDKDGRPESWQPFTMKSGELYTIVGNTGSGKSRFMKDIEQLAQGDTVTGRKVLLGGRPVPVETRLSQAAGLIAHLGQNMRFMLDTSVEEFLNLHALCRKKRPEPERVLELANRITPEPVAAGQNLNLLSGGQTRALMIADIAMICDSPIVLIDEIENAGIDKERALEVLLRREKLVLVVTHDVHTALMAPRRMIMGNGAVREVVERSEEEETLFETLSLEYRSQQERQRLLRKGEKLA